jgi:hypothetical protein
MDLMTRIGQRGRDIGQELAGRGGIRRIELVQ